MANKKFWLGMLVMVLVFGMTVVGLTSCDDDLWSQEDSFTMTGLEHLGGYIYLFHNGSYQHDVKITIDDVTHTIARMGGDATYFSIYSSSKTITVTYSPSNSVRYEYWSGGEKSGVYFWGR